MTYSDALLAVRHSLDQLARWGCRGFDCTPQGLEALQKWGAAAPAASSQPSTLADLRQVLGDCRRCNLCDGRSHIVFGQGNPEADLLFVGPYPGHDDDRAASPFTGPPGELFTRIVGAMKLDREKVYICHVVKCMPPAERTPELSEIETCLPFLTEQIDLIQPKVICTLGALTAQILLNTNTPLAQLRGRFHDYRGIKLMPTLHPADLLENGDLKRLVWDDVKKIMALLRIPL